MPHESDQANKPIRLGPANHARALLEKTQNIPLIRSETTDPRFPKSCLRAIRPGAISPHSLPACIEAGLTALPLREVARSR